MTDSESGWLSSIEEVVEDARAGRMFILVDDEDRENEGDLCIPGEMATPEVVNFMARYARGLVCLSMTAERVEQLDLHPMSPRNRARHQTAFTVSIEARDGVTTGISAADRARTIAVAIDPAMGRDDIVTPGHVFPLIAQDGGVLVRAGHTEAVVDISRMAGLNPSGVICEIMNDDGTMARMPDLVKFAQLHGIKIATIADLIAYRRRNEKLIELVAETKINSSFGGPFDVKVFATKIDRNEHLAVIHGDISGDEPVLVRMHQMNTLADMLGDTTPVHFFGEEPRARGGELEASMRLIIEKGRGVVVILRAPYGTGLSRAVREREGEPIAEPISELRQYGIGAQILLELGVRNVILISNTHRSVIGLDGYGIHLSGYVDVPPPERPAVPKG